MPRPKRTEPPNLLAEYGKLLPGRDEALFPAFCCMPCAIGEVTQWATGEDKCVKFVLTWPCCGACIIVDMRKDAEAKLHNALQLRGSPESHESEYILVPCLASVLVLESLAAMKNFEQGVHPRGRRLPAVPAHGPGSAKITQVAPSPMEMQHQGGGSVNNIYNSLHASP